MKQDTAADPSHPKPRKPLPYRTDTIKTAFSRNISITHITL